MELKSVSIKRRISKRYNENILIKCACDCGRKLTPFDKEGRPRKFINGHNGRKYENPTQFKREWNHRNRPARQEYKKIYGRRKKAKLLMECGGQCSACGLKYNGRNAAVFDFHHRETNKVFNLGINTIITYSWERILQEAKRCDIICANCHRLVHSGEY